MSAVENPCLEGGGVIVVDRGQIFGNFEAEPAKSKEGDLFTCWKL
jgi:hypothetical protein